MDTSRPLSILSRMALAAPLLAAGVVGCANHIGTTASSFMRRVQESPDPNVRHLAYRKLASPRCYDGEEQKAQAARLLASKLAEQKEPVASRAAICQTLGALGRPEGRDALRMAINADEPLVRAAACRALGRAGEPRDAAALTRIMAADPDPDCRIAAIEGLGSLKSPDPRVEVMLVEGMEHADPAIRLASLRALRDTAGKDLGTDPKPWKDYVQARMAAAEAQPVRR